MSNRDSDQFREFINNLEREENRPAALNDILNLLAFKPANEAISTIRGVGISQIVQCLNVSDKAHVDLTCEVLKVCFNKFEPGDVVKNYTSHIMYLLRHEKSCVRRIAIDEVHKAVSASPTLLPVPEYIDVFVAAAQMVSDSDIGVANRAISITSNLPYEAYPKVLDEMKICLEYNSSSKCNVLEVIVNVSCKSNEHFKLCADNNYIDFMIAELQTDDILYQVNILELLSRLVAKPQGINYLVKSGGLNKISEYVTALKDNPLKGLITPGYMKFFGSMAHNYPKEIFEKHTVMVESLFEAFDSHDQTVLPVALDTLGFIGSTIEGKLCLAALGGKYIQTVDNVAKIIKNSNSDTKIRALNCFSGLISIDKDPSAPKSGPIDHRVTLMTREWFRTLDAKPMETLLEMCKNPFPDIRQAAFILLDAVCQHQWGEELVARTAGFIEFLLDRSIVYTKETSEAKYDIIKRLARSPAYDTNITARLQTYVEQGPFYSESVLEVAMEEGEN
ncbi:26S proteasome non-ATPase regulatory subunit 5 [Anticarsia gemmatalis]|uniref:26S proteasome non-ATPase regulatory subunit 5 n=1 Tax=Anticarsia gemmatalis TaxID=129554 RepID=UPI003F7628E9